MPFTKIFGSTAGNYSTATLWRPISVRTPEYAWTASGSGTNEFYLRTAAGGNPGFVAKPDNVYFGGVNKTEGTVGSLLADRWGYGDNDSLGYSTLYARLSDGADPDSKSLDHVVFYQTPRAGEHVRFAVDSASIDAGLDQSAVAIGDFIVEEGCRAAFGSASLGYLRIDPDRFEFSGEGVGYFDLGSAAIHPQVRQTIGGQAGEYGLYLKTTGGGIINVIRGNVAIAGLPGDVATVGTLRVMSDQASVMAGAGVTLTTLDLVRGTVVLRCSATTANQQAGTLTTEEAAALTTINASGGEHRWNSSGNYTTYNWRGGQLATRHSGAARTLTTLNVYRGVGGIDVNKEGVTITNFTLQDSLSLRINP